MVGRSSNFAPRTRSASAREPRRGPSNYEDDASMSQVPAPRGECRRAARGGTTTRRTQPAVARKGPPRRAARTSTCSSGGSSAVAPVSDVFGGGAPDYNDAAGRQGPPAKERDDYVERDEFSFGNRGSAMDRDAEAGDEKAVAAADPNGADTDHGVAQAHPQPNTYSSLIGLIWSLHYHPIRDTQQQQHHHRAMPAIVLKSISILSDAGLGMAMFSLGRAVHGACSRGSSRAGTSGDVRHGRALPAGPAVMAAASFAVGLRGTLLHVAIVQSRSPPPARGEQPRGGRHHRCACAVSFPSHSPLVLAAAFCARRPAQKLAFFFFNSPCGFSCFAKWRNEQAALPQGIVPFVFAKEYNVHPDILSTATRRQHGQTKNTKICSKILSSIIFGMLIALPITLVYYILLGL
ncbi:hypothetical protein HU200_011052 [Digitaria exilis]|uniref:Uncharacterized protein n=1 Tax=Digitaria exilis TaxID=1010633 RepID=A0A835FGY0_9POAL|nr:hypothetical protein HU200_011052 [Digitaria exilis]